MRLLGFSIAVFSILTSADVSAQSVGPCDPSDVAYISCVNRASAAMARQEQQDMNKPWDYSRYPVVDPNRSLSDPSLRAAQEKAVTHGYKWITNFDDLILDAKELAATNAKIQVTGVYLKISDEEYLYRNENEITSTVFGRDSDKFIRVITEDAVRPLREKLLDYRCSHAEAGGCMITIGGHMQMCHYLNAAFTNYPPMPCLHVEVAIQ